MRIRSRTTTQNLNGTFSQTRKYRVGLCWRDPQEGTSVTGGTTTSLASQALQVSEMADVLSPAETKKKKRDWAKAQNALRRVDPAAKIRQFMPCHPCHHVKTTYRFAGPSTTIHSSPQCSEYNQTWTGSFDNAAVLMQHYFGCSDPVGYINSQSMNGTVGEYRKQDWFSLTSQFNEACDSFIPSQMLLGETLYEHSIFVNAFKYLVNPSRITKDFLSAVVKMGLRKKNLGVIDRIMYNTPDVIRGSANSFLSYQFGVKPAIGDIIKTLTAHQIVQQRLWYLAYNGGSYIPIRVKGEFSSSISNFAEPTSYPNNAPTSIRRWYTSRTSTGVISAWGKVRDDLNWKDTWNAYLHYFGVNKVIGLAWELIPFSFVLDWFTNVQERINELTRFRTGEPFSEIRSLTCSLKHETRSRVDLIPGYNNVLAGANMVTPNGPVTLCDIVESDYSRYLSIPETSGVVDFSSLGLFQAIASGALLVQRVR